MILSGQRNSLTGGTTFKPQERGAALLLPAVLQPGEPVPLTQHHVPLVRDKQGTTRGQ